MSVELRWPVGTTDALMCDWGEIEHSCPRPDRGEVGHLMIVTRDYVELMLNEGPIPKVEGALHSAAMDGLRIFAHHDYMGKRWTWELFDAHWADGKGPEIYVGRWPD